MEHLSCSKPVEYLVTMTSPEPSQEWSLYVLSLNLTCVLSSPKLSEAEHLILSLIAKCNHFSDFYFPHWFQLKPRQILDFLPPFLLVEKMPTPRGVQISLCHMERSGRLFLFSLIFIYTAVRSLSHGTQDLWSSLQHAGSFSCGRWTLSCGMWDLVPGSEIELRLPALGVQSLSHWTTREVPGQVFIFICSCSLLIPTENEPPAHCQPPCWLTSGMGSTSCSQHVLHYGAGTRARGNLQNHCLTLSLPSSWTPSPI